MNKNNIKWNELWFEFDNIDEMCEKNYKNLKKKEWKIDWKTEINECSYHHIKHYGVPGECPLCMLKTFLLEKERIQSNDYLITNGDF